MDGLDTGPRQAPEPPATGGRANGSPFLRWLKELPAAYVALNAAIAAALVLFTPERLVPEPIAGLRNVAPLLVAVGILLAWVTRGRPNRYFARIAFLAAVGCVLLALIAAFFVKSVPYQGAPSVLCLVGFRIADAYRADYSGAPATDIIRDAGSEMIPAIWGWSFYVVALVHVLSYAAVVVFLVHAVGAAGVSPLARRRGASRK